MEVKEEDPSSSPMESSDAIPDVEQTASTVNTTLQQPLLPLISPLVPPPVVPSVVPNPAVQKLPMTFSTTDMAVRAYLRQLRLPITLFGESEMERRDRLQMVLVTHLDAEGKLEKLMRANEEEEEKLAAEESKDESTERQSKRRRLIDEEGAAEESKKVLLHKLSPLSDAPLEALANVAGRLGLKEVFNFRGACKSFWHASDRFIGKRSDCWFLIYNENPCTFLTANGKLYQQHLPELEEPICLASSQGWLLMFKEGSGSMFFFAPLSRTRIDIKRFPYPSLINGEAIAVFSSYPTSQHWKVAVFQEIGGNEGELYILECGSSEWSRVRFEVPIAFFMRRLGFLDKPCGGFFSEEVLYFFNEINVMSYCFERKVIRFYTYTDDPSSREITTPDHAVEYLPCHRTFGEVNKVKQALGQRSNSVTMTTCGTHVMTQDGDDIPKVIFNEKIRIGNHQPFVREGASREEEVGGIKGVWFTPET
ncbi:hypothetical protein FEM48_Zijuj09G0207600 [Ziziphus jujuba var. spinosa]|uniref:Pre-mRNA processing factor 4 (PRP4)-like domain-containing protein n=1 Tax=Ziziphus jujuba var. spinosa TaxID=714518 RepID=A0A978UV83_ZIZJJ|nr:uncharacterized protein LOC112492972 isoform X2 [Ziziphus jujuba var. spinosa]KAH7518783.1 hypothetical protein FEM48_Zijuj09G0207600 [Ziziphus jujuba var. spinosa]